MTNWTDQFKTENATWILERGFGEFINAAEMTSAQVGCGLYHELFRDHEWFHISRITTSPDGEVEIEYLKHKDTTENNSQDTRPGETITTEIFERRVIRCTQPFESGDRILISTKKIEPPQGKRTTIVTTRTVTEEPLDDLA